MKKQINNIEKAWVVFVEVSDQYGRSEILCICKTKEIAEYYSNKEKLRRTYIEKYIINTKEGE